MLAARAHAREYRLRLDRVPVPDLRPGEALVRVGAAGVSRGLLALWQATDKIKLLPTVLGHEAAGTVVAASGAAQELVDRRVRVHAALGCGRCAACRAGDDHDCPGLAMIGYALFGARVSAAYRRYHDGGLAEYVRVPSANLDPLPDEIPFEVACKLGSAAVAVRAVRQAGPGETLVVSGASGAAGAVAVAAAPLLGFHTVVAVASDPDGLAALQARVPGLRAAIATRSLPSGLPDHALTHAIHAALGGRRPDALVDFTPVGSHVPGQAIRALRPGGRAVLVAGNPSTIALPYAEIMAGRYQLLGTGGAPRREVTELTELVRSGRLDLAALVTHRFPLAEAGAAADTVMSRRGAPMLVVVTPTGPAADAVD